MRLFIIPFQMETIDKLGTNKHPGLVFLQRVGSKPRIFMHHVEVFINIVDKRFSDRGCPNMKIYGEFIDGMSPQDLCDGDVLFVTMQMVSYYTYGISPFYIDMYAIEDMLLPFETEPTVLSLAAAMESDQEIYISGKNSKDMLDRAMRVKENVRELYRQNSSYKNIMLRKGDGIESATLLKLASTQPKEKQDAFVSMFLSMSSFHKNLSSIGTHILEHCEFEEGFFLSTQEEQVGTFIEFSKIVAQQKKEYVTDKMIECIKSSPEYEMVKKDLARNGLGISETQQFNVFQQVGYFSSRGNDIIYNLSDMGAGKTLMTVEAIYLLDLKQIATWMDDRKTLPENVNIFGIFLADKHIIAPTLSVKSSWMDTFRLFYDVEEISETQYQLSVTYKGITAKCMVYVSSFTVKDGKIFVKEKLPHAKKYTYLIIDEIHQLVNRNIAKTKFFPAKTVPADIYRTFILSGTMSNMKTAQWYNFMRFIGIPPTDKESPGKTEDRILERRDKYYSGIEEAAKNLRVNQYRYFDTDPITKDNYYCHRREKKQTVYECDFFTTYGTQILNINFYNYRGDEPLSVETVLTDGTRSIEFVSDPAEADGINFELFYNIVGSKAITAQSMQVAEELFGEQKKQHTSDIIKTVSPLSKSDIQILKVLHHIAGDYGKYKSQTIAKAINNAILNLNDGLSTKNIYELVSKFAERNLRFFEYLAELDVKILEKLPESGLIKMPKLEDTDKFKVLKNILEQEQDETHLIVVNDYYALKKLSDALGIDHITKEQLKRELDYQETLDALFEKQSIVIVTQDMIKSSLDLVQANRLIQYQLNTEISDIIQTQNRINRIGQTRETRGYYIASDQLQENLIELFLESYRNIRVAHKGIVELFTDITSEVNIINDYLERAIKAIDVQDGETPEGMPEDSLEQTDLLDRNSRNINEFEADENGISKAILFPQGDKVLVVVPDKNGGAFPLGQLRPEIAETMGIAGPKQILWNLNTNTVENRGDMA